MTMALLTNIINGLVVDSTMLSECLLNKTLMIRRIRQLPGSLILYTILRMDGAEW